MILKNKFTNPKIFSRYGHTILDKHMLSPSFTFSLKTQNYLVRMNNDCGIQCKYSHH